MAAEVVTAVQDFRAEVAANAAPRLRALSGAYRVVTRDTERRARALVTQIEAMRKAGQEVPVGRLVRLERYERLLVQLAADVDRFALRVAAPALSSLQEQNVWLAQQHAARIERLALGEELAARLEQRFVLSPRPALEAVVGVMADGAPVREYLSESMRRASVNNVAAAIERVVVGNVGPREAAREVAKAAGIGLTRALTIVRTEANRAYHESQRGRWADSGVVQAYRRTAARSDRTCIACIALDGAIIPINESLEDHPPNRCSMIPVLVVNGQVFDPSRGPTARDWLEGQPETVQRQVMGPGRFAAYQEGRIGIKDMARRVENERFGGAWVPRTVTDIDETGTAGGRAGHALTGRTVAQVLRSAA